MDPGDRPDDETNELRDELANALLRSLSAMHDLAYGDGTNRAGLVSGEHASDVLLSGHFDLRWLAVFLAQNLSASDGALLHRLAHLGVVDRLEYGPSDFVKPYD